MRPQTIQLFLPDGSPTSIREAELTNRLVKAILFPRNKIKEVANREGVHFTGIYFLFGYTEDGASPLVYIGEGEECYKRIQSHNRNKDFWTHAIVVATKTNEWTKTEAKFLEHYCLDKAKQVGRYKTDNDTGSKKPSLSESREYDLLDNFETIKILVGALGFQLFKNEEKEIVKKEYYYCKGKDASATAIITDEGIWVLAASVANLKETKTAGNWIIGMRQKLVDKGDLIKDENVLRFTNKVLFKSFSAAAGTVLGRRANGWIEWKDKEGKTLDELKRN